MSQMKRLIFQLFFFLIPSSTSFSFFLPSLLSSSSSSSSSTTKSTSWFITRSPVVSTIVVSASGIMTPHTTTSTDIKNNNNNNHSIRSIAVVGGTHGNEYTGVFCVKALQRVLDSTKDKVSKVYPFTIQTLIGNPIAHIQNKRFVDTDLNRQFTYKALQTSSSLPPNELSVEQKRALELNQILGPKQFVTTEATDKEETTTTTKPKTDVIIDLHTTTANMGTVIIVGQGDVLTTQAAAYVMYKCSHNIDGDDDPTTNSVLTDFTHGGVGSSSTTGNVGDGDGANKKMKTTNNKKRPFNVSILMHTHPTQNDRPHVASIGRHSFTIEVGAVPQGVLRHDKVEEMQRALKCALEFFKRYEEEQQRQQQQQSSSTSQQKTSLEQELQQFYPSGTVPCYRSAPALKDGELSAKIGWPSDPNNPNFPAWLVHKDIQDNDFQQIETGDPLFVDLDGNVIPYDGSHGSPIRVTFVNEGGYYYSSSGTGIAVTRPDTFDVMTGKLITTSTSTGNDNGNGSNEVGDDEIQKQDRETAIEEKQPSLTQNEL